MLLARIVVVLLSLGIGVSLVLWMLTGQSRYRARAWSLFRIGVVIAFVILALFALERVLIAA
jgi:cytochrome c oxidase assembly factor CtaG